MSGGTEDPVPHQLNYTSISTQKLTHYLFRYPAKFHPPVVRALLDRYTREGQTVFDPFVGSGTLLIEALSANRNAIGIDVDPVAVAISKVKSHRYRPSALQEAARDLSHRISRYERSEEEYQKRMFIDLSPHLFEGACNALKEQIPAIPNITHWFRRYVIIDLASILKEIQASRTPTAYRNFFEIVFASIIRNSSNADPVPVSGLEVTAHMKRKDVAGRLINPFALFRKALTTAVSAADDLYQNTNGRYKSKIIRYDATNVANFKAEFDAVITSPPYQGAVDYYRRHKLEMFWLRHTVSQEDRLVLLNRYIGRIAVSQAAVEKDRELGPLATSWRNRMAERSEARARSFGHYITTMEKVFSGLASKLKSGAPAIFVVGHSRWNGSEIPTSELFEEIAGSSFALDELLFYAVKNRYMSYSRHNGADIKQEFVLAFRRK